ncbi:hypothetical protein PROFUN_06230 [Planoprotostelium fungivorum]|uniref:Uncharacterized protein n=1 Tax=Planoprotostelium fungivorum TaxID=1890364 RepID=A0A2P6NE29_9EUKA|nr:hypothetical protein PROFUN_06230 [Planoprotostelium fungivorum]
MSSISSHHACEVDEKSMSKDGYVRWTPLDRKIFFDIARGRIVAVQYGEKIMETISWLGYEVLMELTPLNWLVKKIKKRPHYSWSHSFLIFMVDHPILGRWYVRSEYGHGMASEVTIRVGKLTNDLIRPREHLRSPYCIPEEKEPIYIEELLKHEPGQYSIPSNNCKSYCERVLRKLVDVETIPDQHLRDFPRIVGDAWFDGRYSLLSQ